MISAFTTCHAGIVNKLCNDVDVRCNGNTAHVKALWDTGATNSCISQEVVKSLSLVPTGRICIRTPSGESERDTYLVDLKLPNDIVVSDLVVIDSEIGAQNIGVLIGMDIINKGDFSVSNFNGQTFFTFRIPSQKKTDYVIELKIAERVGRRHGKGKRKK